MRVFVIFIVIFISLDLNAQPLRTDTFEFLDYNSVIKDLNKNGQDCWYYKRLDFEALLFLDKSALKTLLKVNPHFLKEKCIDTTRVFQIPNQTDLEFNVESNSLIDFFNNKPILNKTLDQVIEVKNRNIDNTIYIKNDQIAILTIWGESWSRTYRVILVGGKVRFELLYDIDEI
jgi:hypothetical protein